MGSCRTSIFCVCLRGLELDGNLLRVQVVLEIESRVIFGNNIMFCYALES